MRSPVVRSIYGCIPLAIPSSWRIAAIAAFQESTIRADAATLTAKALENPVGSPAFAEHIRSDDSVCIIVEDLTRSSPKKPILATVLQTLAQIGIPRQNISIVIALGTHRPLSRNELESAFGQEVVSSYSVSNHDCHADDLVPIGRFETGTAVKINRLVHQADYRIGIGSIFPHPLNGFGGGGKILFPGVADFNSIVEHHLKHSFRGSTRLGILEGNPFYKEVNTMAQMGRLNFIINSVLDHNDRLYDVICGEPIAAHQVGAALCRRIVSQVFPRKSDVTIISAFPYSEGPQIMKPLAPAQMITRQGGSIILYADCVIPLPEIYFEACERFRSNHRGRLRQAVLEHFEHNREIMAQAPPELNMSMAQVMLALNDFKVILVSGDIPANQIERLGFVAARDMDAAIASCVQGGGHPTVNIVPSGGVILPIVPDACANPGKTIGQNGAGLGTSSEIR